MSVPDVELKVEHICWKYDEPGDTEMVFESSNALAHLLIEEQIFLNSNHWEKDWTKEQRDMFAVLVNCSDVFMWACADCIPLRYKELDTLWQFYSKDPKWGTAVWAMHQRKLMPQKPVYDSIQKEGIWDLDKLTTLKRNGY